MSKEEKLQKIHGFVKKLSVYPENENIDNQYKEEKNAKNLEIYLNFISNQDPEILLLGESAGYKGCKLTGIPFTSGFVISKHNIFCALKNDLSFNEKHKENTATIFYDFFSNNEEGWKKTIIWNAFPFHPIEKGNLQSNRSPNKQERKDGIEFLLKLFSIFDIKRYYAIGNYAYKTLEELRNNNEIIYFDCLKIRHPSYGGKSDFLKTMEEIYGIKKEKKNIQKTLF